MNPPVTIRPVTAADLPILFAHQRDPDAVAMAAFPSRDWDAFQAHWAKLLVDDGATVRAIVFGDRVAGNILSWERDGRQLVGYWIGKEFWGKGVATRAVSAFLEVMAVRPLFAFVAGHNVASARVLEKCGFVIDREVTAALPPPSDGVEEVVYRLG